MSGFSQPRRIIGFHLGWVTLVVLLSFVAKLIVPAPSFVPYWYLALAPVGWVLLVLVLLPVSLLTMFLINVVRVRVRVPPRLVAILMAVCVWTVAAALAYIAAGPFPTSEETIQVAITFAIAVPTFGVSVPLATD
jgi:hypothetical protein